MITKGKTQNDSVFIWFLSLYLMLMPLDFLPIIPGVSLSRLLILLPLAGMLFEVKRLRVVHYASLPVLLYLAAAFISVLFTVNYDKSMSRMTTLLLNIGVIILFSARKYTFKELEQLLRATAYSGWFLFFLAVIYSDFTYAYGRMTVMVNGQVQDPNELCGFFVFPICYYLWGYIVGKKWRNLIPVFAFLIVILLTGSRGGLIAVAISSVILIVKSSVYSQKTLTKIFFVGITFLVFLYFAWDYIPAAITQRFSFEYSINDGGAHRFDIWKGLLQHFGDSSIFRKIFGYGVACVTEFSWKEHVAHNIYIESLIEMGIIGFTMLMSMYGYYLHKAWSLTEKYIVPVLIGYLTLAFSLSLYSYKPIWNIILIIVISASIDKQKSGKEGYRAEI